VEQRYDAVLAVIRDGLSVTRGCPPRVGCRVSHWHAWMRRYEQGRSWGALADRSHRPRGSPLQMPACDRGAGRGVASATSVVGGRLGCNNQLGREGVDPLPSISGIYRALRRHGLIEPKAQRKRLPGVIKRWERGRPDGAVADGHRRRCAVSRRHGMPRSLTGVDDHSRFCVAAGIMETSHRSFSMCRVRGVRLRTYGVPEEILTDNGKVFHQPVRAQGPPRCSSTGSAARNGITHRLTAPRVHQPRPARSNGFHRTPAPKSSSPARIFQQPPRPRKRDLDAWGRRLQHRTGPTPAGGMRPTSRTVLAQASRTRR